MALAAAYNLRIIGEMFTLSFLPVQSEHQNTLYQPVQYLIR